MTNRGSPVITFLHIKHFKSWEDTGPLGLRRLTGLFGTNSSGKTSILQLLLMLKQTAASSDRRQVLHTGDANSLVDVGTFQDLAHEHCLEAPLQVAMEWELPKQLVVRDPTDSSRAELKTKSLRFEASLSAAHGSPQVDRFGYTLDACRFGMVRVPPESGKRGYELDCAGPYVLSRRRGRPPVLRPDKFYAFPDEVVAAYQNAGFLRDLVLELERLLSGVAYLGPLRQYPRRRYVWAGEAPVDVGQRGERAVEALLAAASEGRTAPLHPGRGGRCRPFEEFIARKLCGMGLIDSFEVRPIGENRKDYEVLVKVARGESEVLITDVGFGVSQVLPVLVLLYYVPEGSVVVLEQPEIHLHPSVQAALADVLVDAVNHQGIQVIVESHSEHLLRRLQRRMAEGALDPELAALYFCRMGAGKSRIEKLEVDLFGSISNWPVDFFGDEMGDLVAMAEARRRRAVR
jgi:hypothetical protein